MTWRLAAAAACASFAGKPVEKPKTPTSCHQCGVGFGRKEMRIRKGDGAYHSTCIVNQARSASAEGGGR